MLPKHCANAILNYVVKVRHFRDPVKRGYSRWKFLSDSKKYFKLLARDAVIIAINRSKRGENAFGERVF